MALASVHRLMRSSKLMIQYIEIKVIKGRDIIAHGIIVKMMYTICGIGIHPTVWLDLSSDTL